MRWDITFLSCILGTENDTEVPARVPTHGLGSDVGSILQRFSTVVLVR